MKVETLFKNRYPLDVTLINGRKVRLRPMTSKDAKALAAFFKGIPVEERELFKDDVSDPKVIGGWCRELDYGRILPLLAEVRGKIVGDATLHRNSIRAQDHVASIRITVSREYRGQGLASKMAQELIALAPSLNIAIINAEVMPRQKRALSFFESLDFVILATLPQHVRGLTGQFHDLILMSHVTMPPAQLSAQSEAERSDVDIGGSG